MGGHWAHAPTSRLILPHPNTWTLLRILELHNSPPECEPTTNPTPLQWKDEQGQVWLRQNKSPNSNVNAQPDSTQVEEALLKSAIEWDDHNGNTWRREYFTPEEANNWDDYFASELPHEDLCEDSSADPAITTWPCID
eukprot:9020876-Heterocapsa_arctica.AAC.1